MHDKRTRSIIKWIIFSMLSFMLSFVLISTSVSTASAVGKKWQRCPFDELEQASKCVWDAQHSGNDYGRSFFINGKGLHYITHDRAHRMLGLPS